MERTVITAVVLLAGLALMLMPQIHNAVVQANMLYMIGLRSDLPPDLAFERPPTLTWLASLSMILGGILLAVGAALAWRSVARVRGSER